MFKSKEYEEHLKLVNETELEIETLRKKYQEKPDTLLNDYDEIIKGGLIGIIANFRANDMFRSDIITNINDLIKIRKFIVDKYSDNSSNKN